MHSVTDRARRLRRLSGIQCSNGFYHFASGSNRRIDVRASLFRCVRHGPRVLKMHCPFSFQNRNSANSKVNAGTWRKPEDAIVGREFPDQVVQCCKGTRRRADTCDALHRTPGYRLFAQIPRPRLYAERTDWLPQHVRKGTLSACRTAIQSRLDRKRNGYWPAGLGVYFLMRIAEMEANCSVDTVPPVLSHSPSTG